MVGTSRRWSAILFLFLGAACKETVLVLPACDGAGARTVSLAVAQFGSFNPDTGDGCFVLPANASGSEAEYLMVPQSAATQPGNTLNFVLQGTTGAVAAPPAFVARAEGQPASPAERFHQFLRVGEETRRWGTLVPAPPSAGPMAPGAAAPARAPKPAVGTRRVFSVCSKLDCSTFDQVVAFARAVGQHLAIFIDSAAPANGLSTQDLDTLITVFDSRLYPIDTAAFGRASDINQDSVVIVLMTNVVNELVTAAQCSSSGYVAGFFLGADIDPAFATDPRVNRAEVFYSIVADPTGALSCAHSTDQLKRFVPITFIHEFQHMISFNQHVLVRGAPNGEELWLNEGLSHYAEELGGRSYLPADNQRFTDFVIGDLSNAYDFLENTGGHFLLPQEGIGTLGERGAQWLYVRYIVDQYATDTARASWDTVTRRLVQTSRLGANNIQFVTGVPFTTTVGRWALANFVENLDTVPGFTPPAELQYRSWNLRSVFAQLNSQNASKFPLPFPLVPTSSQSGAVDLSGTLRAGSGVYHRALHAPGAPSVLLTFRAPDGVELAPTHNPRLNVIRIR